MNRIALCVLALAAGGCQKPTAQVSGTVKFNGKALTSGVVVFLDLETNQASPPAFIETDGTYSVPLAPVGPMRVLLETPRPLRPDGMPKDSPEVKRYEIQSASYVAIPNRYSDFKNSGVTTELKSGPNNFDIELTE